ncbi:LysR family transcriptional regulator [Cytobacillus sp. Hm23]
MEIRLLEYALAISRSRNFTKAAESLHIAQPSLSKQISKLENELGVQLFIRKHGNITPTPAGVRFLKKAEKIVLMRNDLIREMKEVNQGTSGELIIGSTAVTGGHVLPPLLQEYKQRYPNVQIKLVEESTKQLTSLTAKGEIDIAILALPIEDTYLTTKIMFTESLNIVLPTKITSWMPSHIQSLLTPSQIKHTQTLSLESLSQCPFILLKQGFRFRNSVLELCAKSGFQPQIEFETSSIETAQSLVKNGLGVTIVPNMVVHQNSNTQLTYFKINSNPTRTLVFAYHHERYLSSPSRAFMSVFDELNNQN